MTNTKKDSLHSSDEYKPNEEIVDNVKTWEERFDEVFLGAMYKDSGYSEERAVIKSFITNLLSERDEEIVRMLEGMNRKYLHNVVAKGSEEDLNDTWRKGFNSALQRAIEGVKGIK